MVTVGSAEFILSADSAKLLADLAKAEAATRASAQKQAAEIAKAAGVSVADVKRSADRIAAEHKRAADAAVREAERIRRANEQSGTSFVSVAKAAAGYGAALAGVAVGAAGLHQILSKVAEETQKNAQAQFALNALYGEAAPLVTKFAEEQAAAIGRSRTDAKEAAASVATLARNYALTGDQVKQVLKISADLAAVRGISLSSASERTASAIRGEAEAIEYLGQALQSGALKALANMTDEERKHFETLGDITKAQIILNALTDQTASLQGTAARRANDATGAFTRLDASISNLASSFGQLLAPEAAAAAGEVATLLDAADRLIKKTAETPKARESVISSTEAALLGQAAGLIFGQAFGQAVVTALQTYSFQRAAFELFNPRFGPEIPAGFDPRQAAAEAAQAQRDAEALIRREREAERQRLERIADVRKRARELEAQAGIEAAEDEADRKEQGIREERVRLETERDQRLRGLETRYEDTKKALEAEQREKEKAAKQAIELAERERDAELDAIDAAHDAAIKAITDRQAALARERDLEDRKVTDARQKEDRDLTDSRETEDRARDSSHKDELRRLEERHDAVTEGLDEERRKAEEGRDSRLRSLDRQIQKAREAHDELSKSLDAERELIETNRDASLKAIEDREQALRDANDAALRALEEQGREEDERHRKALDDIEAESKAQLAAIDAQLGLLDAADDEARRQEDAARAAGRIEEARFGLKRAESTGNLSEILKAQRELAAAEDDIRQQGVERERDAQRQQLRAQQEAIRAEADARKRAEDEKHRQREDGLRADRAAAGDALQAQIRALEAQQQELRDTAETAIDQIKKREEADKDALDNTLKRLDKRKQAVRDDADNSIKAIDARRKKEQEEYEEATERENRRYAQASELLQDRRRDEDRDRADRRTNEDRELADSRQAQDATLQAQRQAAETTREEERRAVAAHYNGPEGIITRLKRATEEMQEEYRQRQADLRASYEVDKQSVADFYSNSSKTGALDQLEKLTAKVKSELEAQRQLWEQHRKDLTGPDGVITKTVEDLQNQIKRLIKGIPVMGGVNVGGGNNASSSEGASNIPDSLVASYISNAAPQYGIPAEDALEVWSGEGRPGYVGDDGSSFGPYQLHIGGLAPVGSGNEGPGLGDTFMAETGLDPRDPKTWTAQINWVLQRVKAEGWGPWHAASTELKRKKYAAGGWIREPVFGVGLSGESYLFGEAGEPELVTPRSKMQGIPQRPRGLVDVAPVQMPAAIRESRAMAAASAAAPSIQPERAAGMAYSGAARERQKIEVKLGKHVVEELWIEGYTFNVRRGRARPGMLE